MKALRKALRRPSVACAIISLLVLAAVLGVRARGWLQRPELNAYDFGVRWFSQPDSTDGRIVLIGMTEEDLVQYGYPIDDEKLAQVIEGLDRLEPCVIGLDLYRDLPEPRSGALYPKLEAALKKIPRVLAIERIGYFKAPPALADEPDRIVANNLPKDYTVDGYYRRGPLAFEAGFEEPFPSLSLGLTLRYLAQEKVAVAPEDARPPEGPNETDSTLPRDACHRLRRHRHLAGT